MKVKNINPLGEVLNFDIRQEPIARGEVVEVDDALGKRLLQQEMNWEKATEKAERKSPSDGSPDDAA